MDKLRKVFSSKGDQEAPSDSSKPLSQPMLTPGLYGCFPAVLSVSFAWHNDDKKTSTFFLMDESNRDGAKPQRLYAFLVHKRKVHHSLTLFSGPSVEKSSPLAMAGSHSALQSASTLIALPGPPSEGDLPVASGNRIERLESKNSLRKLSDLSSFTVAVGRPVSSDAGDTVESFEWRGDSALHTSGGRNNNAAERRLVRLNSRITGGEEVVGVWNDDTSPMSGNKLGTFQFLGSGASGELGEYWALMAVMTLLRILEIKSGGAEGLSSMGGVAGGIAGFGLI